MTPENKQTFWLVWSPTSERPPRFRHGSEESATKEAERLARANPGQMFVVLEAKAARRVDDMVRTTFVDESEIPF
ncbi:hypothetical protein [Paraburkholderia caballeronis]|uniref:Uncharacterized protein n=1 Tax=Paraburkholderia caballeronis TaxID=416943 RepID=A0A1H7L1X3_9BURK|nr:hypothetical protein [Paraburkholderia caballeronis]PXW28238.1 hypothetical protein C7403_102130 [Paraburkholderia caballeronis]PXX03604.1 hypothetical protein C7407_102130 [Paraburkholderia caballeronis]RAK04348.1 hypothetical protein C7409_102130 [Paraburkholderia caballeronis]SED83853.1 hypothetical protein SAMN05445871_4049 [Paraburkholderia caballeronis]SEK92385.1 hypothetical protein SAMN05192542_104130 [Paraburkholderia caballeronis]